MNNLNTVNNITLNNLSRINASRITSNHAAIDNLSVGSLQLSSLIIDDVRPLEIMIIDENYSIDTVHNPSAGRFLYNNGTGTVGNVFYKQIEGSDLINNFSVGTISVSNLYVLNEIIGNLVISNASITGNVSIAGNLYVNGNISAIGSFFVTNTNTTITDQFVVSNSGTGPALIVDQSGVNDIASFRDEGVAVVRINDGGLLSSVNFYAQRISAISGTINNLSVVSLYGQYISVSTQLSAANIYASIESVGSLTAGSVAITNRLSVPTIYSSNLSITTQLSAVSIYAPNISVSTQLSSTNIYSSNLSITTQLSAVSIYTPNLSVSSQLSTPLLFASNMSIGQLSAATLFSQYATLSVELKTPIIYTPRISVAVQISAPIIYGTNISSTYLSASTIYNTNLSTTNLSASTIYNTDLSTTNLSATTIYNTNLSTTNLSATTIYATNQSIATLYNTNLSTSAISTTSIYASYGGYNITPDSSYPLQAAGKSIFCTNAACARTEATTLNVSYSLNNNCTTVADITDANRLIQFCNEDSGNISNYVATTYHLPGTTMANRCICDVIFRRTDSTMGSLLFRMRDLTTGSYNFRDVAHFDVNKVYLNPSVANIVFNGSGFAPTGYHISHGDYSSNSRGNTVINGSLWVRNGIEEPIIISTTTISTATISTANISDLSAATVSTTTLNASVSYVTNSFSDVLYSYNILDRMGGIYNEQKNGAYSSYSLTNSASYLRIYITEGTTAFSSAAPIVMHVNIGLGCSYSIGGGLYALGKRAIDFRISLYPFNDGSGTWSAYYQASSSTPNTTDDSSGPFTSSCSYGTATTGLSGSYRWVSFSINLGLSSGHTYTCRCACECTSEINTIGLIDIQNTTS